MNGFQKELRARILGVASHVQIAGMGTAVLGLAADRRAGANNPRRRRRPRRT